MASTNAEIPDASAFANVPAEPVAVVEEAVVVPEALKTPEVAEPVAVKTAPAPKPATVGTKKSWNTISSPDLETKPEYSSEAAARTMVVPTTAYTSDPAETDSTPFTTADGSRVRDGIVAANFLPHGTRIRIPDYFGNKVFEVHDRMNSRYQTRVDIWMTNKSDAYAWGVRNVKIEILP